MNMAMKRRKFWGWGLEDDILPDEEQRWIEKTWAERLQVPGFEVTPPPRAEEIVLRKPRVSVPSRMDEFCTHDHHERLVHSYGKSLADSARIFKRDYPNPPDMVAIPRNEQEISELLDWAGEHSVAVTPFGGGSSVVGGVEPTTNERYRGTVSVDLRSFNKVLEIDTVSEAARIQAGCLGPALESQLKPSGLTLRFFPQSFEFSSLGGWIATRAGGHFATGPTHIDDLVENIRMVTPAGVIDTRRLPGSGAGPSPDRSLIGSEGIYGIITDAWMRVRKRPTFRAATTVTFEDYWQAVAAVRVISQSGLLPANLRLLDAEEAGITGASDGTKSLLVLTFESADHPLDAWIARAIEICNDFGGEHEAQSPGSGASHRQGAAGAWRNKFIAGCYFRENLTARGIIRETFETAITWERFPALHEAVKKAALDAGRRATGNAEVSMTCRFTHVYADGPAPYFTLHVLGNKDRFLEEFLEIKQAVADAMLDAGGTVTHHHAVGRLHRPQYDRQRPDLTAAAMRATKQALDPNLIMNPGILID
jgi:alkyldihydroxyacetonephosphate synthase